MSTPSRRARGKSPALAKAISQAGGQSALARALRSRGFKTIRQSSVSDWLRVSGRAPAELCPAIEQLTGVRCEELRPDVFQRFVELRKAAA